MFLIYEPLYIQHTGLDALVYNVGQTEYVNACSRTWMEWVIFKLFSYLECSVSAVGLVWWLSAMLSPLVDNVSMKWWCRGSGGKGVVVCGVGSGCCWWIM